MAVSDAALSLFFSPAPALLQVWRFLGPAWCCKAVVLARGAGPVARPGRLLGLLREPSEIPWKEWWPGLAGNSVVTQLRSVGDKDGLRLDRIWATLQGNLELASAPTPPGRPLNLAIQGGHRDVAELLLRCGAMLNRHAADELLYASAQHGNARSVEILLCYGSGELRTNPWANVNSRPIRHGGTPLDVATERGWMECAELIRRAGGRHSLHWAAKFALYDDLSAWLAEGADPDYRDCSGATPLWHAAMGEGSKPSDVSQQLGDDLRVNCISALLVARASVDVLPIHQATPLLVAAARGDAACCVQLLAARADPSTKDRGGRTPFEVARSEDIRNLLAAAAPHAALASKRIVEKEPQGKSNGANAQSCNGASAATCRGRGRGGTGQPGRRKGPGRGSGRPDTELVRALVPSELGGLVPLGPSSAQAGCSPTLHGASDGGCMANPVHTVALPRDQTSGRRPSHRPLAPDNCRLLLRRSAQGSPMLCHHPISQGTAALQAPPATQGHAPCVPAFAAPVQMPTELTSMCPQMQPQSMPVCFWQVPQDVPSQPQPVMDVRPVGYAVMGMPSGCVPWRAPNPETIFPAYAHAHMESASSTQNMGDPFGYYSL